MKKLISVLLILALLLPLAALADDFYIARHFTLHINAHTDETHAVKGGSMFKDFDSLTMDLFLSADGKSGYMLETQCVSGLFVSSGVYQVSLVTIAGRDYLLDNTGDRYPVAFDENGSDLWLTTSLGTFRFHLVESMNPLTDWQ